MTKKAMKTTGSNETGFTLIETLVAMVILSVGIFALYSMQLTSIQGNSKAIRITQAATWNSGQGETITGMQYSNATLVDSDGDGTGQDSNEDGADDDGGGFGLDDTVDALGNDISDNSFTTVDGRYTLYMNVAVDVPMKNLKTIRIHVRDMQEDNNMRTLGRPVTFTYIKDDII